MNNHLHKKCIVALLFVLCLGMGTAYAYNFTEVCSTGQTLYYTITNSSQHFVKIVYPGSSNSNPWGTETQPQGQMLLPATVNYNDATWYVKAIDSYAFYGCSELTNVIISEGITSLGNYSFYGCTSLTELTIGESVSSIGDYSFWNCPLLATVHFNAVSCSSMQTSINSSTKYSVFNSGTSNGGTTAITTLTMGASVSRIPDYAFKNSPDLSGAFAIPNNVTYIGKESFYNCSNLTGTLTLPNPLTTIGTKAFYGCSGIVGHVAIPNSVGSLGDYSFYGCTGITELTIGESVSSIGDYSFWNCPLLATVHFNAVSCSSMQTSINSSTKYSVFNIGTSNGGTTAITTLTMGASVSRIPDYAFKNSPDLSGAFSIPNYVTYIGKESFYNCSNLTGTLTLPNPLTTIGTKAFYGCSGIVGHVAIPNSVGSLGDYSFYGCSGITELTIGESVSSIGDYSFWNCPLLATVHFNAVSCSSMQTSINSSTKYSVFNIGTSNGGTTAITTLTMGASVVRIPDYAFKNSPNLSGSLSIPSNVTYIGQHAFYGCSSLMGTLTIPTTVTTIGAYAFNGCSGFTGTLTLPNPLTTIGAGAFYGCSGLVGHVVIPNSVGSLGDYSFYGCSGITELTIGESVSSIGDYSFWNCPLLATVHFNAMSCSSMQTSINSSTKYSVFNIGTSNGGATAITTLTMGASVSRIPDYAFKNSPNLSGAFAIPNNVTYIGKESFYNCSNLTGTLTLPDPLTTIGTKAFYGCSGIVGHVAIPNSVGSLGDYSFYGCTGITELTISENVSSIGDYSFWNCPSLATVHFNAVNCSSMQTSINSSTKYSVFNSGTTNGGEAAITSLTIGSGVSRIPDYAFRNSPYVLGVSFPQMLTTIGTGAFYDCTNLASLTLLSTTPPSVGNNAFNNVPLSIPVFVPCNLSETYAAANGWSQFSNIIELCSNQITAVTFPLIGGTATGSGTYSLGQTCNLTASPNSGYRFVHWEKNGIVVSTNSTYSFAVTESANYVAVFEEGETYIVSASANPSEGGTVIGTGFYEPSQTCTLTASPNSGYIFVNWTENDVEVSTMAIYSFTVNRDRNLVANFALTQNEYHWTVNPNQYANTMNITGIIKINGEEQMTNALEIGAFCNGECRGRELVTDLYYSTFDHYFAFLTTYGNHGDTLSYRLYNHALGEELELSCAPMTFASNATYGNPIDPYVFDFISNNITQTTQFGSGWNWWSCYMEANDLLDQIETGLGANGIQIKSKTHFVQNGGSMWVGLLNEINNESTYLIQTNSDCEIEVTGNLASSSAHPITLSYGWNWIGYTSGTAMSVATAFSGITPRDGDQLKSQVSFAQYLNGSWSGSLTTITPGMGLLYQSNAEDDITLVYPEGNRNEEIYENVTNEDHHWTSNAQAYPSNMTVTAIIKLDDIELSSANYEIAAFANGECRGSTKLMYVAPLKRYLAFLTIAGDESTELSFALYNTDDGAEYFVADDALTYTTNAIVGDLESPFIVNFRGATDEEELDQIHIFPNPVSKGEVLNIATHADDLGEVRMEIINTLGMVETQNLSSLRTFTAPEVAGIYTLRITIKGKGTHLQKLVVK